MNVSRRSNFPSTPVRVPSCTPRLAVLAITVSAVFLAAPVVAQGQGQAKGKGPAQTAPAAAEFAPGRLLVHPRPGLSEVEFEKILRPVGGRAVGRINGIDVRIIQLPPQASERAVAALLRNSKHLKFVELDMRVQPGSVNDPRYSDAWHLPKIGADAAWSQSNGKGVTIAILDSGVDGSHPDLVAQMVPGWNIIDNNSNTADVHGHGTIVAGAAAATTNNGVGVASVAGGARIMPIRIADANAYAYWSDVAKGLTWAADNGAKIANISYNGVSGSSTVQKAAQYLKNKGGVTVVAAGNSGGLENIAPSDTMISVSATTSKDVRPSWSSYGEYVDLAAPGASIWTTRRGGSYGTSSGTSLSSPVVAGTVALVMEANPSLGPTEIEHILFSTAFDIGTAGHDIYYGHGRIATLAAVQAASGSTAADTIAPTVSVTSPSGGANVGGLVAVDVAASDNVGVSRVELYVNGKKHATDTAAPYAFSWDSTTVGDGTATLTASAYDAAGNYSSHAVSVKVENAVPAPEPEPTPAPEPASEPANDTIAPTTSISNPSNGSRVNGNVDIQASASDNVGVTGMRLFVNGRQVASSNGGSISYRWAARLENRGTHTISVEAQDAAGNVGTHSVSVTR